MAKVIICRDEAAKQFEQFKDQWGFEDPQAIAGGEAALPEAVNNIILTAIMLGRAEFMEGGKKIVYRLRTPVKERTEVNFTPASMKQYERRELDGCESEQAMCNKLLEKFAGLSAYEISEMSGKDVDALSAFASTMLFI